MKAFVTMMAGYNAWANTRLYAAVETLSEAQYFEDRGAFFGSLHGTLNHILVGDHIWMHRFTGDGPLPAQLDTVLHDTLTALRAAREAEDARIIAYTNGLSEADLRHTFTYTPVTSPEPVTQPLAPALAHLFNHQTHHRGQAHGMLSQLSVDPPSLDLIRYQRERGVGMG
ncbi:DinB family protein [Breoghania sp. L-A4]|uniref:DinB family protein n=1 Tax=Breoghania sp. L-A4 TaxID=2304600 RepID=UPI000E359B55|nr:DinB family protein [Breoghania sp. L-A4]AXS40611.1 damage-inducible protein DinB [Breoghania sp. L-A4]